MTIDALIYVYPWIKSLHIISFVAWMAGLFYLPRLYVYHTMVTPGTPESERMKIMERRLLKAIMNPAMIATWTFGILLVLTPGVIYWGWGWWHTKLFCVLAMTVFHHGLIVWRRGFLEDRNRLSERFFRIANEVPTLLMIVIVIMVFVRPY